jgi:hypothetical protein
MTASHRRASRNPIDVAMTEMNRALVRLFTPMVDACKSDGQQRGMRTMLVAILVNKAVDLIRGAADDDRMGGKAKLRALAQDILDGKLRD